MTSDELKRIIEGAGITSEVAEYLQTQLEPHLTDQTVYTTKDQRSGEERRQIKAKKGSLVNERRQETNRLIRLPGVKEHWIKQQRSGIDRRE